MPDWCGLKISGMNKTPTNYSFTLCRTFFEKMIICSTCFVALYIPFFISRTLFSPDVSSFQLE
ncbi:hypothetical protein bcere0020_27320 [Bacillus cereus Rock3-29]|nr:hypothetical protein bcere0020_27320 [Bacillus cereus Rock3-29]